ncbi:MAG: hypothetical protein EBV16_13500, partial [Betaproteobacteria bacterium]|nr:hypothetical protein [Betaproteobacteria bacterium]
NSIEILSLDTVGRRLNPNKPVGVDNYFCRKITVNVHVFSLQCLDLLFKATGVTSLHIEIARFEQP